MFPVRIFVHAVSCVFVSRLACRVCDAPEKNKYPWAFKMIHESTDVKTLFFAVDTDFDLKASAVYV